MVAMLCQLILLKRFKIISHMTYICDICISLMQKNVMSNESAKSNICASDSRIHDIQMSDGDKSDAELLLKIRTHVIC